MFILSSHITQPPVFIYNAKFCCDLEVHLFFSYMNKDI